MSENWVLVCAEADIEAEAMLRFDHGDQSYCIYHTKQGFFATDGYCTHDEQHLCEGRLLGTMVECPLHQACFDVTNGAVLCAPAYEDLASYPVKLEDYRVWIQLAD